MLCRKAVSGGQVLAAVLLVVTGTTFARAACQGDSCPEEHAAAKSAGLLGQTAACDSRTYPLSGSKVQPVSSTGP